jgi:uncharacterized membrane protein YfhO
VLVEQFFPGWEARIDGRRSGVERADGTFQATAVPAGRHTVEFRYAPASLRIGALVTLFSVLGVIIAAWPRKHILELQ